MKLRRNDTEDVQIDMSPMIDMVFLLLIFFLVASQIVKVEKADVELPFAVHAVVPEDETGRFMISVDEEGNLFAGVEQNEVDDLEALRGIIRDEVTADKEVRIVIRADDQTKFEDSEEILTVCGEEGAKDMIFAAFEGTK